MPVDHNSLASQKPSRPGDDGDQPTCIAHRLRDAWPGLTAGSAESRQGRQGGGVLAARRPRGGFWSGVGGSARRSVAPSSAAPGRATAECRSVRSGCAPTRLTVTVTTTACMIVVDCRISPRSTINNPRTRVPIPRGPNQPMNSLLRAGRSLPISAVDTATRRTTISATTANSTTRQSGIAPSDEDGITRRTSRTRSAPATDQPHRSPATVSARPPCSSSSSRPGRPRRR